MVEEAAVHAIVLKCASVTFVLSRQGGCRSVVRGLSNEDSRQGWGSCYVCMWLLGCRC